jgi:hypothetical protein
MFQIELNSLIRWLSFTKIARHTTTPKTAGGQNLSCIRVDPGHFLFILIWGRNLVPCQSVKIFSKQRALFGVEVYFLNIGDHEWLPRKGE